MILSRGIIMREMHISQIKEEVTHMSVEDDNHAHFTLKPTISAEWDDYLLEVLEKDGWVWNSGTPLSEYHTDQAKNRGIRLLKRPDDRYVVQVAQPGDERVRIILEPKMKVKPYNRFDYVDLD